MKRLAPSVRPRSVAFAAALVAIVLCGLAVAGRAHGRALAPTAEDTELLAVHAALDDLHHEFFRPVTTTAMLNAGWDAALNATKKVGIDAGRLGRPVLEGDTALAVHNFDQAYRRLNALAAGQLDPHALGRATIAGIAASVHENHTYYIDPERWTHRSDASSRYAGIGVTISYQDGAFYASEVYPDTPAARGGLRPGDRFVSIDGHPVAGQGLDWLVKALRGVPGTTVDVNLRRGSGQLESELRRDWIVVAAFESRRLEGGVGYVRLRSFPPAGSHLPNGKTLAQALDAALDSFETAGATAWVLDLRNNGGGYLDGMDDIASRFLPQNAPVLISHSQDGDSVTRTTGGQRQPPRPLAVLINAGSASASEILASALQEGGRAFVVGDKSAGVANAANLDALPNGGGLSITSVQSLTAVQRHPLDGQGVTPDSPIAGSQEDIPIGRDRQLERAAAVALARSAAQ